MGKNKKTTTISRKLTLQVSSMITAILVIIMLLGLTMVYKMVDDSSKDKLKLEAQAYQYEIEGWIGSILKQANAVYASVKKHGMINDKEEMLEYLKEVTLDLDKAMPLGMYVGSEDGSYYDPTGWEVPADESYIIKERSWFKDGINYETMTLGAPYYGANMNTNMVSASAKLNDTTVMATDITLDTIVEQVNQLEILGDGYGFIIDHQSGFIIAHKNPEYIGKNIDEIDDKMVKVAYSAAEDTENVFVVREHGKDYWMKLNHIQGTQWILATCAQRAVLYKGLYHMSKLIILGAIAFIIGAAGLVFFLVKRITAPLGNLTYVITEMTKGDFTVTPEVKGNDEITIMSQALKEFVEKMQITIKQLYSISDTLNDDSNKSTEISKMTSVAAESQTEAMTQLNMTVDELARSVEEIANDATSLASTVSEVNGYSHDAMGMIQETVEAAEGGKVAVNRVADKMNTIDETMQRLEVVVKEVGISSNEINEITTLIGGIATQTNLLALNASIEAARAGEAGKGFAVVATEIGNLANSSADAVQQIGQLITKVTTQIQDVIERTANSVEDINESKALVDQTLEAFMNIYERINRASDRLNIVTEKMHVVDEVASNMAAITEEQSAGTEEILGTSENVLHQSERMTKNSEELNHIAQEVQASAESIGEHIRKFKI